MGMQYKIKLHMLLPGYVAIINVFGPKFVLQKAFNFIVAYTFSFS